MFWDPKNVEDKLGNEERERQRETHTHTEREREGDKCHFKKKPLMDNSENNNYIPGGGLMCKPFFRLHCTGKRPGLSA